MNRLALFLVIACPVCASAQTVDPLPGARVRVRAPGVVGPDLDGTIAARTADSLVIATPTNGTFRIGVERIEAVSVFQGRSRMRGAVRAGLWTTAILAGLDLLAPPSRSSSCGSQSSQQCDVSVGAILVLQAMFIDYPAWLIGGAVGADVWKRVDLRSSAMGDRGDASARDRYPSESIPAPGTRVRVDAPGVVAAGLEGTVVARTHDSVVVATPRGLQFTIDTRRIRTLDRIEHTGTAGAKNGALWGAAIGIPLAPVGAIEARNGGEAIVAMTLFAATYIGIGAGIGALAGADEATSMRAVPRVSFGPNGRLGVGMSIH